MANDVMFVISDEQASVVKEAIKDSKFADVSAWVEDKVETLIKAQRTANLAKSLRGMAAACKLSLSVEADASVEDFIFRMKISDRVQEFGGLGAFVRLANSTKGEYIPESKIHRQVVAVSAADVKAGK